MINTYDNYEEKVNNENIIWGYWPGLDRYNNKTYKMFRIMPGIWMLADQINHTAPDKMQLPGVYDPYYVSTEKLKSKYLQQISALMLRLASKDLGKALLQSISNIACMTYKKNPTAHIRILRNEKADPYKNKNVIAYEYINVLITPPNCSLENLSSSPIYFANNTFAFNNSIYNTCGCPSVVQIAPDVVLSHWDGIEKKVVFQDNVVALSHELIHALHSLLGVSAYSGTINSIGTNLEEGITFGSYEAILARKNRALTLEKSKLNFIKYTNKIINENLLDHVRSEFIDNILHRYQLIKDKETGTISFKQNLDESFQNYIDFAWNIFNETKLASEFGVPNRSHYSQDILPYFFYLDHSDPKLYSIENGIGGRKKANSLSSDKPLSLSIHPKFYENKNIGYYEMNNGRTLKKFPPEVINTFKESSYDHSLPWKNMILHDQHNYPNPEVNKLKGPAPVLDENQIEKVIPTLEKEVEELRIELKDILKKLKNK